MDANEARRTVEDAHRILRADYYGDVRRTADCIAEWWKDNRDAGRESLLDYIDETIDGSSRVIYTAEAIECLRYSDNDSIGLDELGADGFNFRDGIPWPQLAYFAFRQDVIEQLDAIGLDVNNPEHDTDDDTEENE